MTRLLAATAALTLASSSAFAQDAAPVAAESISILDDLMVTFSNIPPAVLVGGAVVAGGIIYAISESNSVTKTPE